MEFYLGQIIIFGGNFAIRGLAFAHGQLLPISQNTALFSLYGTMYGGDGRTTFALPDLRGRTPVGHGNGPGLGDVQIGQRRGNEYTTLNTTNLPSHSHTGVLNASVESAVVDTAGNNFLASDTRGGGDVPAIYTSDSATMVPMNSRSLGIGNTGGNQAFSNVSPQLGLTYQVALQGIFPSRN